MTNSKLAVRDGMVVIPSRLWHHLPKVDRDLLWPLIRQEIISPPSSAAIYIEDSIAVRQILGLAAPECSCRAVRNYHGVTAGMDRSTCYVHNVSLRLKEPS